MTRDEICNSMTIQDAVRVLKETNCYGTMDIAKTVIIKALEQQPSERTEERTETHACDCISRQAAIGALWKALHEYEDKTENQFSESKELDVADWFQHRIFVQNMSDIDRQTILDLPSATPPPKTDQEAFHVMKGKWITQWNSPHQREYYYCSECGEEFSYDGETGIKMNDYSYCPNCGSYNGGAK